MSKIEARGLRVSFGQTQVIAGVDLSIPDRSITALMGPSGSGKSTLLRVFNRLIELYPEARVAGEAYLDGRDIFKMDVVELRRRVQMVFQIPNPIPNLSIFENVALGLKLNRLAKSRRELQERVRWALEKAQLWDEVKDRLGAPAGKLSGGQQQRLCMARALAFQPEVLLADEPTANLDPENTAKIEALFLELKKDMAIVMVTHFPQQAARISDYVAFLYRGQIVEWGATRDIFTNPKHELTERYVTGRLY
ncbi:ATP-binding cassette domain-containing protein [Pyrobaculum neutrophilum]|uniref:ABC transporter related n=1 Tax=Pyrobaculum neutrophilum (strain DSM 2338 / JCM 9278 / NBRC 100436 / V24Sta) TaxID=444157 RepID=B1YCI0_PYRNV|nr:ATP-binding cassette domain-containing protein [Pyrobaculum neutrophilum]ACB39493.1 ABC transporter related [Pyrobaculum neutrophilum V24Sta]